MVFKMDILEKTADTVVVALECVQKMFLNWKKMD